MTACRDVRKWFTEALLVPVTSFITEAREKCEELQQAIEENVARPVERWISQAEQSCNDIPWWNPARWICAIVMIVIKIVEWVVVTVIKWVAVIVCQVVAFVVGLIVELVLRVVGWFVTFVVCLFSEPLEALKSFRDLWAIIWDAVDDIFAFLRVLFGDVIGILTDVERLLDSLAGSLGWLGIFLGILKGLVQWVRLIVSTIDDFFTAFGEVVGGLANANLCRILRGLTDAGTAVGRFLLDTGFAPLAAAFPPLAIALLAARLVAAIGAGIRDSFDRVQLEALITERVGVLFGTGTVRTRATLARIGVGGAPMGYPFRVDPRRMFLNSNSNALDLRALHNSGVINLYQLANYVSDCGRVINEPEGEVVYAGSDLRVSASDLDTFLATGPGSVPEFHVFPITRARFRTDLETARRKASALGIDLLFDPIGGIEATSPDHVPLRVNGSDFVQQELFRRMGRTGMSDDLSVVPAISHFHYVPLPSGNELFGVASQHRASSNVPVLSGVTYRNRTPDWAFRWVLVHELGHYWGLDHPNAAGVDRGIDEIMWTPSTGFRVTFSMLEYLAGGEPRFTFDDARKAWEWMTRDASASLFP